MKLFKTQQLYVHRYQLRLLVGGAAVQARLPGEQQVKSVLGACNNTTNRSSISNNMSNNNIPKAAPDPANLSIRNLPNEFCNF
jgi:hypothetical protein